MLWPPSLFHNPWGDLILANNFAIFNHLLPGNQQVHNIRDVSTSLTGKFGKSS
jgi:hypothetical protein